MAVYVVLNYINVGCHCSRGVSGNFMDPCVPPVVSATEGILRPDSRERVQLESTCPRIPVSPGGV